MHVPLVKIKASIEIFAFVILVQFQFNNYVEAEPDPDKRILRNTCLLKPDPGPCRGNIIQHYYDPKIGKCKRFYWGGCQGNGNRFDSREECYSNCLAKPSEMPKERPRFCFLNFDYGFCFGGVSRYYYDPMWKVCKERLYSGCGGNKNNFYNIEQCESICRFGNGHVKSDRLRKGQIKKVLIIDPPIPEVVTTQPTAAPNVTAVVGQGT